MSTRTAILALLLVVTLPLHAGYELSPVRNPVAAAGQGIGFAAGDRTFLAVVKTFDVSTSVRAVPVGGDGTRLSYGRALRSPFATSVARLGDRFVAANEHENGIRLTELGADGASLRTVSQVNALTHRTIRATTDGEHLLLESPGRRTAMLLLEDTAAREATFRDPVAYGGADDDEFFFFSAPHRLTLHRLRSDGAAAPVPVDLGPGDDLITSAIAASNGTDVLVVRSDERNPLSASRTESVRVSASGAVEVRPIAALDGQALRPVSLTWTGREYLLLLLSSPRFDTATGVVAMRLAVDGTRLGEPITLLNEGPGRLAFHGAAWNGERIAFAASVGGIGGTTAVAVSVAADLTGLRTETLSVLPPTQQLPRVASSGRVAMVVWHEPSLSRRTVKASLFSPDGPLLADDITLGTSGPNAAHRVAYGGGAFLAVWQDVSRLLARRISASGAFLDAQPIVLANMTDTYGLAVASDGNRFLVFWSRFAGTSVNVAVVSDGVVAQTATLPATGAREIDADFDGTRYFAAWSVEGAFLDTDGRPLANPVGLVAGFGTTNVAARPGGMLLLFPADNGHYAGAVTGSATPVLGTRYRSPLQLFLEEDAAWNGSAFVAAAATLTGVTLLRRDSNGAPLPSRVLTMNEGPGSAALAVFDDREESVVVEQRVFTPGEVAVRRLVVYRESEFSPLRGRLAR